MNEWRMKQMEHLRSKEGYDFHSAKKRAHLDEIEINLHGLDDSPLRAILLDLVKYLQGDHS